MQAHLGLLNWKTCGSLLKTRKLSKLWQSQYFRLCCPVDQQESQFTLMGGATTYWQCMWQPLIYMISTENAGKKSLSILYVRKEETKVQRGRNLFELTSLTKRVGWDIDPRFAWLQTTFRPPNTWSIVLQRSCFHYVLMGFGDFFCKLGNSWGNKL